MGSRRGREPGCAAQLVLIALTLAGIGCVAVAAAGALKALSGWAE